MTRDTSKPEETRPEFNVTGTEPPITFREYSPRTKFDISPLSDAPLPTVAKEERKAKRDNAKVAITKACIKAASYAMVGAILISGLALLLGDSLWLRYEVMVLGIFRLIGFYIIGMSAIALVNSLSKNGILPSIFSGG